MVFVEVVDGAFVKDWPKPGSLGVQVTLFCRAVSSCVSLVRLPCADSFFWFGTPSDAKQLGSGTARPLDFSFFAFVHFFFCYF